MNWMTLLYLAGAGLMVWLIIRMVRSTPGAFSKKNLSKSVYTIGWLTIILFVVIAFCVWMLKG